jgi:hypothetical protein
MPHSSTGSRWGTPNRWQPAIIPETTDGPDWLWGSGISVRNRPRNTVMKHVMFLGRSSMEIHFGSPTSK